MKFPRSALALLVLLPTLLGSAHAKLNTTDDYIALKPEKVQESANIHITRQLQHSHYLEQAIDEGLSEKVFDSYLDALDGQRLYFLASDIQRFQPYRSTMAEALKSGDLEAGFDIYNTYQERLIDRLRKLVAKIDKGIDELDFTADDYLEAERKDHPWELSQEALDTVWDRRVKGAVLSLKLSGNSNDEIQKTLKKRYESQLNRALRVKSEDAFQVYMNAFTASYDPHTQYFSPSTSENFNINMSLSLEGIGAVLQSDNEYTKVVRLVPAGPAYKQGQLRPADRIVGVGQGNDGDMVDVVGWRLDEVVQLIRGPKQTTVRLEVIPASSQDENQTRVINIVRDKVKLEEQAASSEILEVERNGQKFRLGVIDIPTFYADFRAMQAGDPNYRSTTRDVRKLIEELKEEGIDGLIVDLRNNGGGALHEANELTGLFIKEGPTVQIRSPRNRVDVLTDPDSDLVYGGPLAVMVNRMSASASEIFAGAIQDYNRGIILGGQTFGKGTVQSIRNLNHGQLKITQAKFYRVSGASTQHKGVIPDIYYPSIIDKSEIGEDALPEALPWDSIQAIPHQNYAVLDGLLGQLKSRHEDRIAKDPEFSLLREEKAFLEAQRMQTRFSLNEKLRATEKTAQETRQLELVNAKRKFRGEEAFKSFADFEADREALSAAPQENELIDAKVKESGQILVDLIELRRQVADADSPEAIN